MRGHDVSRALGLVLVLMVVVAEGRGVLQDGVVAPPEQVTPLVAPDAPGAPTTGAAPTDVSPFVVGTARVAPRFRPRPARTLFKNRQVTALPAFRPVTVAELPTLGPGGAFPSVDNASAVNPDVPRPQANGIARAAFSESRFVGPEYTDIAKKRVGRLYIVKNGGTYKCTASVINKALLVTAAHCVFDWGQGNAGWPDKDANGQYQVYFRPGLDGSNTPYGTWWANALMVLSPYFSGTDTTNDGGTTVNNDIALVWLLPNANYPGKQIGDVVGYLGYNYNGYSFVAPAAGYETPTAPVSAVLSQFGYPGNFDSGTRLQCSIAAAYIYISGNLKNIVKGGAMDEGASGGPWVTNYGVNAALSGGITYGSNTNRNQIMGVSSWDYADATIKLVGASYFGTNKEFPSSYGTRGQGNIAKLMYDACDSTTGWKLKSLGLCN